jgi:hypothetical protein
MPWHAGLHPNLPIIETSYSGVLSRDELAAAFDTTAELVRTTSRTLLLGDCSLLDGGHSLVDLWAHAESLGPGVASLGLKEAVILPGNAAAAGLVKFWETTCLNRGINVRAFSNRSSAVEWLLAK